jgi:hypothetical protein
MRLGRSVGTQDRARRPSRWGHGMGNWLIERFTLLGVTFHQNGMILALAVILVGALIAWWRGQ